MLRRMGVSCCSSAPAPNRKRLWCITGFRNYARKRRHGGSPAREPIVAGNDSLDSILNHYPFRVMRLQTTLLALALIPSTARAQQASFVYRLGKDTVAIE